jgi:mRNA-degrading endonuclease toxin of MazEF toxin-antitoxin module
MTRRGDVVVAVFPYVGGGTSKNRPAVVVQADRLNHQIGNTVLAMITGNTKLIGKEPTQFLIDPGTPDGKSSGLAQPSAVKCENLMTVFQNDILHKLGHLSDTLKNQLNSCLKAALGIP